MATPQDDQTSEAEDNTEEARALYAEIREDLGALVVGRDELLDRLALTAFLHQRGTTLQRMLLVGPSGAGKTHVARAVAEVTGAPFLSIDAQQITETGWAGMHLDEFIAGFAAQVKIKNPALLTRSVVLVDEVDKIRIHPEAHGNALDKPRSQQTSLLALFGVGTPVRYGTGANDMLDTSRVLVMAAGAFSQAEWYGRKPTSADLVSYGLMLELVDRLGETLLITPPTEAELIERYRNEVNTAAAAYSDAAAELGYRMVIPEQTYLYVARHVLAGGAGLREGGSRLSAAAAQLLAKALREGRPAGSTLTLSPDCLEGMRVPPRGR